MSSTTSTTMRPVKRELAILLSNIYFHYRGAHSAIFVTDPPTATSHPAQTRRTHISNKSTPTLELHLAYQLLPLTVLFLYFYLTSNPTKTMAWMSGGSTNAALIKNLASNGLITSERVKTAMLAVSPDQSYTFSSATPSLQIAPLCFPSKKTK